MTCVGARIRVGDVDTKEAGRMGGKARAKKLTELERKASAEKAAAIRWVGHVKASRVNGGKR